MAIVILALGSGWLWNRQHKIERGRTAFRALGCMECHSSGAGPDLTNVGSKYDRKMLVRFIENPDEIYGERSGRTLNEGYMRMPRMHATPEDTEAIVAYLTSK